MTACCCCCYRHSSIRYFLPYLRLLVTALRKYAVAFPRRCCVRSVLFRGTKLPLHELRPPHRLGDTVTYWAFSSTSTSSARPVESDFVTLDTGELLWLYYYYVCGGGWLDYVRCCCC